MTAVTSHSKIARRVCRRIDIGGVVVGAGAPVAVQAKVCQPLSDIVAVIAEINALASAGATLVRVACEDHAALLALYRIIPAAPVPIIAEIPLTVEFAREATAAGAACLSVRLTSPRPSDALVPLITLARNNDIALEIVAGAKVLDQTGDQARWPDSIANAALEWAQICIDQDFTDYALSLESHDVMLAAAAYRRLAAAVECPLYLSLGSNHGARGDIVGASMTLGTLLRAGIGDTIRVALPSDPLEEAKAGVDILKALGLSHRGVTIVSCPGCARQRFDVSGAVASLEARLDHITTGLTVSVMGCVVNGPGEAKQADIALVGSGRGAHTIYVDGRPDRRIDGPEMVDQFAHQVEEKAERIDAGRLHQQAGQLRVASQAGLSSAKTGSEVAELAVALNHVFPSTSAHVVWDNEPHAQLYAQLTRRRTPMGRQSYASSISEMLGVAVAGEQSHGGGRPHDVVVIRKELLSAGLTYEAMNNAGNLKARLIIVLVDEVAANAKHAGAMTAYLSRLTSSRPYLSLRDIGHRILQHFPQQLTTAARRAEEYARCIATGGTLFEELGLYYVGLVDGNNLDHMLPVLRNLREAQFNSPVLLHVVVDADSTSGEKIEPERKKSAEWLAPTQTLPDSANPLAKGLFAAAAQDPRVAIVTTAGLQSVLEPVITCFEERCHVVDRADQHAVHFAAGLCRGGLRPIVVLDTANHLRALAGIAHDLVRDRAPIRFVVAKGGDGATGLNMAALPGFAVATPADDADFLALLSSEKFEDRPLLIYPSNRVADLGGLPPDNLSCRVVREGRDVAIVAFGDAVAPALAAADALGQLHVEAGVIDGRFARPLDLGTITGLLLSHEIVIIAEPFALNGMAGEVLLHLSQSDELESGAKIRKVTLPSAKSGAEGVQDLVGAVLRAVNPRHDD